MTENVVPMSPKEKAELNIGTCIAVLCPERCEFYAYDYTQDSFRICVCGHSQHTHARGEA